MTDIVIAGAARTPVGAFNGGLSSLPAHELGRIAIAAAMERAGVAPEEVDEVVMGQILTAAAGQNPARQAAIAAGIPVDRTAYGVKPALRVGPAHGPRSRARGSWQAMPRSSSAGGQESMSQAPHAVHLRNRHQGWAIPRWSIP